MHVSVPFLEFYMTKRLVLSLPSWPPCRYFWWFVLEVSFFVSRANEVGEVAVAELCINGGC